MWTSSALNSSRELQRVLAPGRHELTLFSSSQGAAWGAQFAASGELHTVFNWGIGGLPGTLDNPILPTEIDPGDFGFDIVTTEALRFYDPVIATGYDYVASSTPFASVLIPAALPGGDSQFQLLIGSEAFELQAGELFHFTAVASEGVSMFGIRGIDPGEQLDPNDPTAFITGLSFVEGGRASSFRMTAVTGDANVVPEASSALVWAALLSMGALNSRTLHPKLTCKAH